MKIDAYLSFIVLFYYRCQILFSRHFLRWHGSGYEMQYPFSDNSRNCSLQQPDFSLKYFVVLPGLILIIDCS